MSISPMGGLTRPLMGHIRFIKVWVCRTFYQLFVLLLPDMRKMYLSHLDEFTWSSASGELKAKVNG